MKFTAALSWALRPFRRRRVLARWSESFVEEEWMHERVKVAASWINASSKVLDLGCGMQLIKPYLATGCVYAGADLEHMHPDNLILDLDTPFVLPDTYDTVVLLGVLEFLNRPLGALKQLKGHCSQVILSYLCRKGDFKETAKERRRAGAKNHWNEQELFGHLLSMGFIVEHEHTLWDRKTHQHLIVSLRWK